MTHPFYPPFNSVAAHQFRPDSTALSAADLLEDAPPYSDWQQQQHQHQQHHDYDGGFLSEGALSFPDAGSSSYGSAPLRHMSFPDSDRHSQAALEKRRRRRESHNAVERRRRDNINDKIQELASLIPNDLLLDTPPTPGTAPSSVPAKPNKGAILRKSVDYIRYLRDLSEKERTERIRLEDLLKSISPPNPPFNHPWDP